MEWLLPLILQTVVPADQLMEVTLNKSLAQVIQEQISYRKELTKHVRNSSRPMRSTIHSSA